MPCLLKVGSARRNIKGITYFKSGPLEASKIKGTNFLPLSGTDDDIFGRKTSNCWAVVPPLARLRLSC